MIAIINEVALEHDKQVHRTAALIVAIADLASAIPGEDSLLIHVQSLAAAAAEHVAELVKSKDAVIGMLYAPEPA